MEVWRRRKKKKRVRVSDRERASGTLGKVSTFSLGAVQPRPPASGLSGVLFGSAFAYSTMYTTYLSSFSCLGYA